MLDHPLALVIAFAVPLLLIAIWWIANYNRMIRLRNHIKESWADIDVELKRRYELIPNLVETVKGYAKHERDTFERVIELRNKAKANHGTAAAQSVDENALIAGMGRIYALAEGYPELKSNQNYLELQRELSVTEDRIAAARRFYNGNVRDLKTLCEMFPTSIIAKAATIEPGTFFELDDERARAPVAMDL